MIEKFSPSLKSRETYKVMIVGQRLIAWGHDSCHTHTTIIIIIFMILFAGAFKRLSIYFIVSLSLFSLKSILCLFALFFVAFEIKIYLFFYFFLSLKTLGECVFVPFRSDYAGPWPLTVLTRHWSNRYIYKSMLPLAQFPVYSSVCYYFRFNRCHV